MEEHGLMKKNEEGWDGGVELSDRIGEKEEEKRR